MDLSRAHEHPRLDLVRSFAPFKSQHVDLLGLPSLIGTGQANDPSNGKLRPGILSSPIENFRWPFASVPVKVSCEPTTTPPPPHCICKPLNDCPSLPNVMRKAP